MTICRSAAAILVALWAFVPAVYAQEASPQDAAIVIQATVTAYAAGADGGNVGTMTASGTPAHWGTVAADWRLYPPGTRLQIEGFPNDVFVVEDSGGAVRGNVFDIWFADLPTAVSFGTRSLHVTILPSPGG